MSVLIFDEDNKISIPVATERYFTLIWEKAIKELNLKYIGNSKIIYFKDLSEILDEFSKVRVWALNNLNEKDKKYVINHIDYILQNLPKVWNEYNNITELYMG